MLTHENNVGQRLDELESILPVKNSAKAKQSTPTCQPTTFYSQSTHVDGVNMLLFIIISSYIILVTAALLITLEESFKINLVL